MKKIILPLIIVFLLPAIIFAQQPPAGNQGAPNTPPQGTGGQNTPTAGQEIVMLTFESKIREALKDPGLRGREITLDALLISASGDTNTRLRLQTLSNEFVTINTTKQDIEFRNNIGRSISVIARINTTDGSLQLSSYTVDEDNIRDLVILNQEGIIAVPEINQTNFDFNAMLLATTNNNPQTQFNTIEEEIAAFMPVYAAKIIQINSRVTQVDANNIANAILTSAHKHNLDPRLLFALIQIESRFNKNAVSTAGAQGLGQLMPATARALGVGNPFDIAANVDGAARYIAQQLKAFDNDLTKALAAYNAGPNRVRQANGVPNIRETRNYVELVWREYSRLAGL